MTQVTVPKPATGLEWPPCPPWCVYGPCTPADGCHVSDTYCVPVVADHRECSYKLDASCWPGADALCDQPDNAAWGICVTLSLGEGKLEIVLRHGADELPSMTVDAAESLANGIQDLVRQARSAA